MTTSAQWVAPPADVPAYNAAPPKKSAKLAPILPKHKRLGRYFQHPVQVRSYEMAEEIHAVLYQMPCYCYCDRGHGHNSLRSCFEDAHGAGCDACMREVFYTYQQLKKGVKPAAIRRGIIAGEWKKVDYQAALRQAK